MALGKGKYDDALGEALITAKGVTGVLIILDGEKGAGFSVHVDEEHLTKIPMILESMAGKIRDDIKLRITN